LLSGQLLSEWNPLWFSGFPWLRFLSYPLYYLLAGISAWGGVSLEATMVGFYMVVLAGSALAMFAYLRTVLADWRAALIGALVYEVFPYHNHVGVETWIHAAFWAVLPLPLWAIERGRTKGPQRIHYLLLAGLALGLFPVISSEYALIAGPFVVLYFLARLGGDLFGRRLGLWAALRDVWLVGVIAVGFSCFFVLPGLMETNSVGIHAKHGGDTTFTDVLLRDYVATPRLIGYAILKRWHRPASIEGLPGIVRSFWSVAWYPGVIAPLLTAMGLILVRRRFAVKAALVGLLLAALLAQGPTTPLNVFSRVPVLGRLSPFRFMMLVVACLSALAAHGAEWLLARRWPSPWLSWVPWALSLCLLAAMGLDFRDSASAYQTTAAYYGADTRAAYAWLAGQDAPGRLWEVAAQPREQYLRTYSLSLVPRPRHGGYYDNGAPLHTWQQLSWTDLRTVLRLHQVRYVLLHEGEPTVAEILGELGQIGYRRVYSVGRVQIWENEANGDYVRLYGVAALDLTGDFFLSFKALPLLVWRDIAMISGDLGSPVQTWGEDDLLLVKDTALEELRWRVPRLQERLITVDGLAGLPEMPRPQVSFWLERSRYDSIYLQVESGEGGVLTIAESWYPHWRVYVDGHPQPLLRVNWALLGVRIGPGRHQISFRFQRPLYFYVGYIITLGTLLGIVIWWSWYVGHLLEREPVPTWVPPAEAMESRER
ncbi:MAG: YfhO family protein, partial [Chloroflexi bacterium]|nr:YfhO family protein [Chloroflexota bacterium]